MSDQRTYGETKDCKGCRFWSEMVARCDGGGPVLAMCLVVDGPRRGAWTAGRETCIAWASGHDGAIDEPGSDPTRYEAEESMPTTILDGESIEQARTRRFAEEAEADANHASENTAAPFQRELRYVTFKIADIQAYLPAHEIGYLKTIGEEIESGRKADGRPEFNAVVVEHDWPEFDLVWQMIEARMTGGENDSRRIVACVKACARIETPLLEEFPGGINGMSNVAIAKQRNAAWSELREIREAISANSEESTADEVRRVVAQRDALLTALRSVKAVANNSSGIAGWHLNGDIASWDELLPEVDAAIDSVEHKATVPVESEGGEA